MAVQSKDRPTICHQAGPEPVPNQEVTPKGLQGLSVFHLLARVALLMGGGVCTQRPSIGNTGARSKVSYQIHWLQKCHRSPQTHFENGGLCARVPLNSETSLAKGGGGGCLFYLTYLWRRGSRNPAQDPLPNPGQDPLPNDIKIVRNMETADGRFIRILKGMHGWPRTGQHRVACCVETWAHFNYFDPMAGELLPPRVHILRGSATLKEGNKIRARENV